MRKGNVPQVIQQGDKVIIRLSDSYLAAMVAHARANGDYSLMRRIREWIHGEVVNEITTNNEVVYVVKSNIPRKISGFWHFDIYPNKLNDRFGGIIIRKPDPAVYKGKRK